MINSVLIKSRMIELGVKQKDLAKILNLAKPTVSQKLNNVRPMSLEEANIISKVLKIDIEDFGVYFFKDEIA